MVTASTRIDSTLEPLGIATGLLLVLVGVGTLSGAPWTSTYAFAGVLQTLGGVLSVVLGIALAWLVRQ